MSAAESDRSHPFDAISDRWLVGGYHIYVECGEGYSDAELMERLGISGYSPAPSKDSPKQPDHRDLFVQIANDGRWAQTADDGYYTLWHSKYLRDRIAALAALHNIFTCSFGDADNCFDFEYYEGSRLRRRYVFMVPPYETVDDNGSVAVDYGTALPGEEKLLEEVGMYEKIEGIAGALGIVTDERKLSIRTYTKPYPKRSFLGRLLGKPDPDDLWRWCPWEGL